MTSNTTSRLTEIHQILLTDAPAAFAALTQRQRRTGAELCEIDWPCGITLRVTKKQAQVIVHDADDDIMDMLARTGYSFCRAEQFEQASA